MHIHTTVFFFLSRYVQNAYGKQFMRTDKFVKIRTSAGRLHVWTLRLKPNGRRAFLREVLHKYTDISPQKHMYTNVGNRKYEEVSPVTFVAEGKLELTLAADLWL
jgi:hypothetical protein